MLTSSQRIELPKNVNLKEKSSAGKAVDKYPWYLRLIRFGFSTFGPFFPKIAARQAIKLFSTPRKRAKHRISDLTMEQAKVFEFMFKGKILKAYEWGYGSRTVLLVHGWESRGTALRSFVPKLLEEGYKVVTFDAPAHGNSSGKQTNLVEFAGAIKAIVNQIGGVHGIVAHSLGGAATVYALSNLNQTEELKRLVLISSPSRMMSAMEEFLKLIRAPKVVEEAFYGIVKNELSIPLDDIDTAKMRDRISVGEVMIVHDKEDPVVGFENSERVAKQWEGSTFVVTEGFGHFQLVKNAQVVELIGKFMREG